MESPITSRQFELLDVIYEYIKTTGYPPSFEEMRAGLNVSSNQSILDLLRKLKIERLIKREESGARSITILPLGYKTLKKDPLVQTAGITSAGMPIEAIGIHGEWRPISGHDDKLERLDEQVFMLKVQGDSMINAGIDDGDAVLVQTKKEFVSGEVVLARIGDNATIKKFVSDDKPPYVYLKPENPKYEIIPFTDEMILEGKIISVLKNGYWKPIK